MKTVFNPEKTYKSIILQNFKQRLCLKKQERNIKEQAEAEVVPNLSSVEVEVGVGFGFRLSWLWLGFQIKI